MDKTFDPKAIESRWYRHWEAADHFAPSGKGNPYAIMLPPPNVTGSLHMGHAFQDTIMDLLVRYHRMLGDNTLWQAGTDHAGIATQMVVERQLQQQDISRHDLGREAFVDKIWEWKEQSGGTITRQLRRLGASLDWSTERFTMDEELCQAVAKVFVQLYDEGLIYRGKRLVNWDPVLHTAISDLEVISEEEQGHLWHLRYPASDGEGFVTVATTRPETMLGDTAVAVHPDDERYQHLIGKSLKLPLTGREIPVIADEYVDQEFGSGCVKITPAHDFNDYEMGQRHQLDMINVLTPDGCIGDDMPAAYAGMDRFAAREKIVADLDAQGLLEKTEPHKLMVPRGDRSGTVIEPFLTDQWFVKAGPLAEPAIEAVESGRIEFVPGNWSKTYFEWMRNIQDWCISRQLWWGHRIPAWFDDDGNFYVGESEQDARKRGGLAADVPLRQDEDVLDTWFSSALWPFTTQGWPEQTSRLKTFYPGAVLVTGFDIIFFWVARMIMMGLKFMGEVPFHQVYIHGLVRDSHGQKMSKSKGNVLDPIDLIDGIALEPLVKKRTSGLMQPQIAKKIEAQTRADFPEGIPAFGTDAMRFTFTAMATTGRDIRLDISRIEGYSNYCNKLWNAARFVLMNTESYRAEDSGSRSTADEWVIAERDKLVTSVRTHFDSYRFDLAAQALYEFTWNQYCDWYLELSKPTMQGDDENARAGSQSVLLETLEILLRLHHPIMPFITEEIWQSVAPRLGIQGDSISLQTFPNGKDGTDTSAYPQIDWLKQVLLEIRRIRSEMQISPGKPLNVLFLPGNDSEAAYCQQLAANLKFLGRLESITTIDAQQDTPESAVALAGESQFFIPLAGLIDVAAEQDRLRKSLDKCEQDHGKLAGRLANEKFVANAPEQVVQKERGKLAELDSRMRELSAQLEKLSRIDADKS